MNKDQGQSDCKPTNKECEKYHPVGVLCEYCGMSNLSPHEQPEWEIRFLNLFPMALFMNTTYPGDTKDKDFFDRWESHQVKKARDIQEVLLDFIRRERNQAVETNTQRLYDEVGKMNVLGGLCGNCNPQGELCRSCYGIRVKNNTVKDAQNIIKPKQ